MKLQTALLILIARFVASSSSPQSSTEESNSIIHALEGSASSVAVVNKPEYGTEGRLLRGKRSGGQKNGSVEEAREGSNYGNVDEDSENEEDSDYEDSDDKDSDGEDSDDDADSDDDDSHVDDSDGEDSDDEDSSYEDLDEESDDSDADSDFEESTDEVELNYEEYEIESILDQIFEEDAEGKDYVRYISRLIERNEDSDGDEVDEKGYENEIEDQDYETDDEEYKLDDGNEIEDVQIDNEEINEVVYDFFDEDEHETGNDDDDGEYHYLVETNEEELDTGDSQEKEDIFLDAISDQNQNGDVNETFDPLP